MVDKQRVVRAKDSKRVEDGLLIRVNDNFFVLVENEFKKGDLVRILNFDKIKFMIIDDGKELRQAREGDVVLIDSIDWRNESFVYSAGGCEHKGYLSQVEKVM